MKLEVTPEAIRAGLHRRDDGTLATRDYEQLEAGTLMLDPRDYQLGAKAIAMARGMVGFLMEPSVECGLRAAEAARVIAIGNGWDDVITVVSGLGHGRVTIRTDRETP